MEGSHKHARTRKVEKPHTLYLRVPIQYSISLSASSLFFPLFLATHACMHTRMHTHAHTHTHARTHARMHTHTHTHTHSKWPQEEGSSGATGTRHEQAEVRDNIHEGGRTREGLQLLYTTVEESWPGTLTSTYSLGIDGFQWAWPIASGGKCAIKVAVLSNFCLCISHVERCNICWSTFTHSALIQTPSRSEFLVY